MQDKNFRIVVVGVGGTGSWLVNYLSLFIYSLQETQKKSIDLLLIDDDIVTETNLYRQNFAKHDIGKNKAELLASRYGNVRGIEIKYLTSRIETKERLISLLNSTHSTIPILIGCIDNNKGRRIFHEVFNSINNLIWIDAGNEQISGQVIVGVKSNGSVITPPVTELYPSILDDKSDPPKTQSCGQIGIENLTKSSQYFSTNLTAANIIFNFIYLIVLGLEFNICGVNFNTLHIHTKPTFINELNSYNKTI